MLIRSNTILQVEFVEAGKVEYDFHNTPPDAKDKIVLTRKYDGEASFTTIIHGDKEVYEHIIDQLEDEWVGTDPS